MARIFRPNRKNLVVVVISCKRDTCRNQSRIDVGVNLELVRIVVRRQTLGEVSRSVVTYVNCPVVTNKVHAGRKSGIVEISKWTGDSNSAVRIRTGNPSLNLQKSKLKLVSTLRTLRIRRKSQEIVGG